MYAPQPQAPRIRTMSAKPPTYRSGGGQPGDGSLPTNITDPATEGNFRPMTAPKVSRVLSKDRRSKGNSARGSKPLGSISTGEEAVPINEEGKEVSQEALALQDATSSQRPETRA